MNRWRAGGGGGGLEVRKTLKRTNLGDGSREGFSVLNISD